MIVVVGGAVEAVAEAVVAAAAVTVIAVVVRAGPESISKRYCRPRVQNSIRVPSGSCT